MAGISRLDVTGAQIVSSSVGLLIGWLVSGIAYAGSPLPDAVCALIWLAAGAGIAYWLHQRMTGPYADWSYDKLVHTRFGMWVVTVGALLALITIVRVLTGLGDDLGELLWGFDRL